MSSDYRAPIWPFPVTIIAVLVAAFGFMFWLAGRPAPSQEITVKQDAAAAATTPQGLSVLDREHIECDRQVAILMSTKDLVELERAKYLISEFSCAVGRRLPPP